jgi:tetratricopeptide (TPR) repeat protein
MKKLLLILLCVPMIGSGQTAYDYFIEAKEQINNKEYQLAIDLYSECINLLKNDTKNTNLASVYNNRGNAYSELGNYEDAIADYTRAIRIDPDYASAYYNRGIEYKNLKNYEDAIADYTRAIRIDPDYVFAYKRRGNAKEKAGLPYWCSDYKKCCDLGDEDCCEWYYKDCK